MNMSLEEAVSIMKEISDDQLTNIEITALYLIFSLFKKDKEFRIFVRSLAGVYSSAILTNTTAELFRELQPVVEKYLGKPVFMKGEKA